MCGLVGFTLISNRKFLESNFTRRLAELRNPIFLRGSWRPLGWTLKKAWTFPNFQVLQLSKILTEAIPPRVILQKKGCLKTSSRATREVPVKYSSVIPCGDSHKLSIGSLLINICKHFNWRFQLLSRKYPLRG